MNSLLKKIIIKPEQLIQSRAVAQWYLTRKKIPIEMLNDDYQPADKVTKLDLKRKQMELMKRDRRVSVSWEVSVKYLESEEFKAAYRGLKVWIPYRRNMRGIIEVSPRLTRNRCIVNGFIVTGSPCPICRDRYLVLHPKNVKLLEQFINPASDDVYPISKIMLCEYTYENLISAVEIARDRGYLQFRVPFRQFDYEDFYSNDLIKDLEMSDKWVEYDSTIKKAQNIINPTNHPYTFTHVPL